MAIFTTLSVVIWFSTGTLGIFATLVYVFTMRVVIYDIMSMGIIPTLSTTILFCNLCYILLWISPHRVVKIAIRIKQTLQHWYIPKKLIYCVAIFTILYGNYYPPHGEFKLICIGKFGGGLEWISLDSMGKIAKGVKQMHFTMLYGNYCYIFIENFPNKFSPCMLTHKICCGNSWCPIVTEIFFYVCCHCFSNTFCSPPRSWDWCYQYYPPPKFLSSTDKSVAFEIIHKFRIYTYILNVFRTVGIVHAYGLVFLPQPRNFHS